MNFINVTDDLGQDVSKNVCYIDLVAMVTIQGLSLAKNCNKRNSKTKGCVTMKIGIDVKYTQGYKTMKANF